jgi:hypothetical protein
MSLMFFKYSLSAVCILSAAASLPRRIWSKGIWSCRTVGFRWQVHLCSISPHNTNLTLILYRVDCKHLVPLRKICFLRQVTKQETSHLASTTQKDTFCKVAGIRDDVQTDCHIFCNTSPWETFGFGVVFQQCIKEYCHRKQLIMQLRCRLFITI